LAAPKKPLTLPGYRALLAEHEELSRVERPRVVVGVTNAAAEGERSHVARPDERGLARCKAVSDLEYCPRAE
jgi:transcription elongation GreA/GreB family factor